MYEAAQGAALTRFTVFTMQIVDRTWLLLDLILTAMDNQPTNHALILRRKYELAFFFHLP